IAFWAPIASMVMIAPLISTSLRISGIAVISFDFAAQATCPSDRPNSLAQTLTECKAPRPFLRSWLRRAVLPSTARRGCSTPVAAAAAARSDSSQLTKQARKASGGRAIRTQRKTSLRGTPSGKSRTPHEELLLEGDPFGDGGRPVGAGQDRHEGDDDD